MTDNSTGQDRVMTELLPCPFCGSDAVLFQGNTNSWVICSVPGCGCEQTHDTPSQVIAAWNTRMSQASPPPLDDEVERVASAISPNLFRLYPNGRSQSHEKARSQARAAIVAMSQASPPPEAANEIERLRETLRMADDALRDHACHGGVTAPCLRSTSECRIDCGKKAGDALIIVEEALSLHKADRQD